MKQYSSKHQALISSNLLPNKKMLGLDDHLAVVSDLHTKSPPKNRLLYNDHQFAINAMSCSPGGIDMHYTEKETNPADELTRVVKTSLLSEIRTTGRMSLVLNKNDVTPH